MKRLYRMGIQDATGKHQSLHVSASADKTMIEVIQGVQAKLGTQSDPRDICILAHVIDVELD
jgi:hypothetical protein